MPNSRFTFGKNVKAILAHSLEGVGNVRGLKAPPRKTVAPDFFAASAIIVHYSSLSTEHGPAMTWKLPPPNATPPTSTTVSSG